VLTVGSNGRIKAQVSAKAIVNPRSGDGQPERDRERSTQGVGVGRSDIVAPRVAIADGSHFRGSIDMQKKDQPADKTVGTFSKPEPKTAEAGDEARALSCERRIIRV